MGYLVPLVSRVVPRFVFPTRSLSKDPNVCASVSAFLETEFRSVHICIVECLFVSHSSLLPRNHRKDTFFVAHCKCFTNLGLTRLPEYMRE